MFGISAMKVVLMDLETTPIFKADRIAFVTVGKFRPQLIELTSFKPKLLIRFIINKTC